MVSPAQHQNPSANIIRSLLKHTNELSVYSKDMPYALTAEVIELNLSTGHMVLGIEYAGLDIERYFAHGSVNFDLEDRVGRGVASPVLSHHRAYGSVPRRFMKNG